MQIKAQVQRLIEKRVEITESLQPPAYVLLKENTLAMMIRLQKLYFRFVHFSEANRKCGYSTSLHAFPIMKDESRLDVVERVELLTFVFNVSGKRLDNTIDLRQQLRHEQRN